MPDCIPGQHRGARRAQGRTGARDNGMGGAGRERGHSVSEAWIPRALRAEQAALYVGLSTSTFLAQVAPAVPPVKLTVRRQVWLREDLDRWLDMRAGRAGSAGQKNTNNSAYDQIMGGYGTH